MQRPFEFDLFGETLPEPKPRKRRELTPRDHRLQLRIFWMRNPEKLAQANAPRPEPKREKVVLIGCGKSKLNTAAKAKDLYTGPLFKARRAEAEASGARWFIVSAKHGLLDPEAVIEPYDVRLGDNVAQGGMFQPYRRNAIEAWGAEVVAALAEKVEGYADLEIHAGADYRHGIISARRSFVRSIASPTAGLGVGQQLAFYKNNRSK